MITNSPGRVSRAILEAMRILAVSDSHHDLSCLVPVLRRFAPGVDLIAHLGDGVGDLEEAAFRARLRLPRVEGVRGNGDHDPGLWTRRLIGSADRPILLLHGHLEGVSEDLNSVIFAAEAVQAKLVLFGHTHRPFFEEYRGILALNPGSISRPRDRDRPTFAVIEVPEDPEKWFEVQFYEIGPRTGRIREIELG
jgi:putative phosphoesterase